MIPQSVCLTTTRLVSVPSPTTRSNAIGRVSPTSVSSPRTLSRLPLGRGLHGSRAELDRLPLQDLVADRRLDARLVIAAEWLHPAGALAHPERGRIDVERDAGLRGILTDFECRLPGGDVDQEIVSGLRSGAGAPGPHREGAVLGPERVRACRERHRRTLVRRQRDGQLLAVEGDLAAERAEQHHGDRRAEIPLLLAEDDRSGARGDGLERSRFGPSTVTCTSVPPCRAAAAWSAASERSTASGSTMTVAPVPVAPAGASSSESASRVTGS